MTDIHSKETRSYNMSRIRSKNTKPELLIRKHLFACGFRFRVHSKNLPGKPDIVLPMYKTVIFVHGCFWHGHTGCRYFVVPKTRTDFWMNKILGNRQRDSDNILRLQEAGWNVISIFECELKNENRVITFAKVLGSLNKT